MRHIAIESGAFVVSVPQFIPRNAYPDDFPITLPADITVLGNGGACIVGPSGNIIAGPVYGKEATVVADCDLREALHAKRYFDAAGHYSRSEVLNNPLPRKGPLGSSDNILRTVDTVSAHIEGDAGSD